jgi:hypothetical protein
VYSNVYVTLTQTRLEAAVTSTICGGPSQQSPRMKHSWPARERRNLVGRTLERSVLEMGRDRSLTVETPSCFADHEGRCAWGATANISDSIIH